MRQYMSGMWLGVAPRTNTMNTYVYRRLAYMLKSDNQSKLNSQHN